MTGPFDHPWLGGLFGDDDMAKLWSAQSQLTHMCAFEAAFARALGHVGMVDAKEAEQLAQQIASFTPDMAGLKEGTARDGVVVPALVRQMKAALSGPGIAIHSGATSQDVIDTALALTLRDCNDLLITRLGVLADALETLQKRFGSNTMMGRTRMQAALPISVADRLRTWSSPIAEHKVRLAALRSSVERLQLGGPVGDRKTLGAEAQEIAAHMGETLGLIVPAHAWHTNRIGLVDYASLLSLISGSLGKMGQDICLMAQQGIDEIAMDGGGGSSAMAHKQNPVLPELLVTLAKFNATQVSGMHHALVHEQERSGAAWALEWMILPQMAQATGRSVQCAIQICQTVNRIGS